MGLDFGTRDEERFSLRQFLKTFVAGIAVFLVFMAIGAYVIGPRLVVDESGRPRLRLGTPAASQEVAVSPPQQAPMPKVEIYEKLPPDITAGTGLFIGAREVAPFDYERYQQKRKARKEKQAEPTPQESSEAPPALEDDYFVPDEPITSGPASPESAQTPELPSEPAIPAPAGPTPPAPSEPTPAEPTHATNSGALYRVQVGVYGSRENANRVAQELLASGFEASIVPFQRHGTTLYRVQTLVTRDRAKAESQRSALQSKGFPAVIVEVQP